MKTISLTIPYRFAQDRAERDLPLGEGAWTSRGFRAVMTQDQADDLLSDADYYADPTGMDVDAGLVASARATVRALVRAGFDVGHYRKRHPRLSLCRQTIAAAQSV